MQYKIQTLKHLKLYHLSTLLNLIKPWADDNDELKKQPWYREVCDACCDSHFSGNFVEEIDNYDPLNDKSTNVIHLWDRVITTLESRLDPLVSQFVREHVILFTAIRKAEELLDLSPCRHFAHVHNCFDYENDDSFFSKDSLIRYNWVLVDALSFLTIRWVEMFNIPESSHQDARRALQTWFKQTFDIESPTLEKIMYAKNGKDSIAITAALIVVDIQTYPYDLLCQRYKDYFLSN
jgi:hypothetical protein